MITDVEMRHLERCVELAAEALDGGDEPFGSVLVTGDGVAVAEGHNQTSGGDQTRHPEFELARWSTTNLTPEERQAATVFTSGEHCPMCAAAHAWVGLGRIVYAVSTEQLVAWREELGDVVAPVTPLPVQVVAPGVRVEGPVPELEERMRQLHARAHSRAR
jgi:tRNA(Arg) A34 adenosine deaminase TadA